MSEESSGVSGGIVKEVHFMVDTGAAVSALMPNDSEGLGIDYAALPVEPRTYIGAGGIAYTRVISALLIFEEPGVGFYVYRNPHLSVLEPRPEYRRASVPSLLGRDILNRWEMLYNPAEGLLEFSVNTADSLIPIQ